MVLIANIYKERGMKHMALRSKIVPQRVKKTAI